MNFAGGSFLAEGTEQAAAANITPDPTGISYYDEGIFLKMMRTGYVGARTVKSDHAVSVLRKHD